MVVGIAAKWVDSPDNDAPLVFEGDAEVAECMDGEGPDSQELSAQEAESFPKVGG
jgi:hypothetical protein